MTSVGRRLAGLTRLACLAQNVTRDQLAPDGRLPEGRERSFYRFIERGFANPPFLFRRVTLRPRIVFVRGLASSAMVCFLSQEWS
jgi:hypothetical protein